MDEFRRRPPLGEGYLRNKRGGEAFEDDSVEGHSMPANPNLRANADDDKEQDVEGHGGFKYGARDITAPKASPDEDDTEGHGALPGVRDSALKASPDEDDTEGHGGPKIGARDSALKASPDDDDTEGHGARDLK